MSDLKAEAKRLLLWLLEDPKRRLSKAEGRIVGAALERVEKEEK